MEGVVPPEENRDGAPQRETAALKYTQATSRMGSGCPGISFIVAY